MFKIGDLSKLSQVPVKTLRYYDEIGLLKPTEVDTFTGYRYYSADQLPRLNRILALKDLGLSLTQIAQLLDDNLPPDQIRGMLRLKQTELQQQVQEDEARLVRVEWRLKQIEEEETMSAQEMLLKTTRATKVASIREVIPTYSDVGRLFSEIFVHLGQHGVKPAAPPFAIYYDQEYRDRDVDVEAVVPVASSVPKGDRVTARESPEAQVACTMHQGSYDTIGEAYTRLLSWIGANGYHIAGPCQEVYMRGPESVQDPSTYVTEVQVPVEKG